MMLRGRDLHLFVVALILGALVATGPGWAASTALGDGTATVAVVSPAWLESETDQAAHHLQTTPGRFGTEVSYVRIPDLHVDVTNLSGRPEIIYAVRVPELGVDIHPVRRRISSPGSYRLHHADVALPPSEYSDENVTPPLPGTYTGFVTVRVQSFSGQHVVANRTVEVVVDE